MIKEYTKQVMHNAIAHHPLTDVQSNPEQQSQPLSQLPPVYTLSRTSYPLWPVWVSCPDYAPCQLLVHLLAGRPWEAAKSL